MDFTLCINQANNVLARGILWSRCLPFFSIKGSKSIMIAKL